tara:strand:+ start:563 stop:1015 length:453 start_codon:yes stop_codon:yes gene_type:complete
MKTIKINWGTGIAMLYLGFVAMIIVLVIMSTTQKIDLVTEKYYHEELEFQHKIDKQNNTEALELPLSWKMDKKQLTITFPANFKDNDLAGIIHLYCPSDNTKDRQFKLISSHNTQQINLTDVPNGRYLLQVDWQNGTQKFWNDGAIQINH